MCKQNLLFLFLPIHGSTDDQNVVFENESDKGLLLIIEGGDASFIISETVAWDNCCAIRELKVR